MQTQEIDIIGAMLAAVREMLGQALFTPQAEKAIEAKLRTAWGGQDVYVRLQDVDAPARALDIRARYNMSNRRELQAEYGLSRAQFYKILKGADRRPEDESHFPLEMRLQTRYRDRTTSPDELP